MPLQMRPWRMRAVPSLSDTQGAFRDAVTGGPRGGLLAMLRCPADAAARLDIYRRHHRESFRRHLRGRYPTLEWLLGTERLVALADETLRHAPPRAPSMAAYGQELVETVLRAGAALPPYIADVARTDWALGCISVAIDHDVIGIEALAAVDAAALAEVTNEDARPGRCGDVHRGDRRSMGSMARARGRSGVGLPEAATGRLPVAAQ